ncbi:FecR domain-containing protein [Fibrobacterota bacterium]
MSMISSFLKSSFKLALLAFLGFVLVLTSGYAYKMVMDGLNPEPVMYAMVDGNVEKPGYYKISDFTTNFDLLEKAGLTDSSNISHIDLIESANPQKALEVGVSKKKVKPKGIMDFSSPEVIYFMGNVSYEKDLKVNKVKLNKILKEKEVLLTRADGKSRIRFKNFAEMDINTNTKIRLDKMDLESSPSLTVFKLDKGQVFLKVPKATPNANLVLVTPTVQVELTGEPVEFMVSARPLETSVHVGKGMAYVTRLDGGQKLLLKEEQIVVVRHGEEVLEAVKQKFTHKTVEDAFGDLEKAYLGYQKSQDEVSILITGGTYNLVASMLPKKNRVVLMDLPPNTYVGDYIDGVFRLDQSLLLAGSELTREIVQRLIGRPVPYVIEVDFQVVGDFAYIMGGLTVEVDPGAAFTMGVGSGLRRLTRDQLIKFLNPRLPGGRDMATVRQKRVLMAFFKEVKRGSVAVYTNILTGILTGSPTNLSIKEGVNLFKTYAKKDNWQVMNITLPTITHTIGPMVLVKPRYDRIHSFYN